MNKKAIAKDINIIAETLLEYGELIDDKKIISEGLILKKIASDYGEIALSKFHKKQIDETEEEQLEDERKGEPEDTTEIRLPARRAGSHPKFRK